MQLKILPSLFAADFGHLADEIKRAEDSGADMLHIDVMDAHFVPNLGLSPGIVEVAKKATNIPLNVHLMMTQPERMIKAFADAGADTIQIHVEATCNVTETLKKIRSLGVSPGIVLNPLTPHTAALPYIEIADECLQMTVFPGYGGQAFKPEPLPEIRRLREAAKAAGKTDFTIMVDGGIDANSIGRCAEAGANAFVAGTALFSKADMKSEIEKFRKLATDAFRA